MKKIDALTEGEKKTNVKRVELHIEYDNGDSRIIEGLGIAGVVMGDGVLQQINFMAKNVNRLSEVGPIWEVLQSLAYLYEAGMIASTNEDDHELLMKVIKVRRHKLREEVIDKLEDKLIRKWLGKGEGGLS